MAKEKDAVVGEAAAPEQVVERVHVEEVLTSAPDPAAEDAAKVLWTVAPVKRNPSTEIGIDQGSTGDYAYVGIPVNEYRSWQVVIAGQRYEHVAEDGDGCWLYRVVHR